MWFDWQVVGGSQGSQVKLSDGSVKTVTAAHLSKPGSTTLRMTGGIITATTSSSPASTSSSQQVKYMFMDCVCVFGSEHRSLQIKSRMVEKRLLQKWKQ